MAHLELAVSATPIMPASSPYTTMTFWVALTCYVVLSDTCFSCARTNCGHNCGRCDKVVAQEAPGAQLGYVIECVPLQLGSVEHSAPPIHSPR